MHSLLDYLFITLYGGLVFSISFMIIRRRHYKGFKKQLRISSAIISLFIAYAITLIIPLLSISTLHPFTKVVNIAIMCFAIYTTIPVLGPAYRISIWYIGLSYEQGVKPNRFILYIYRVTCSLLFLTRTWYIDPVTLERVLEQDKTLFDPDELQNNQVKGLFENINLKRIQTVRYLLGEYVTNRPRDELHFDREVAIAYLALTDTRLITVRANLLILKHFKRLRLFIWYVIVNLCLTALVLTVDLLLYLSHNTLLNLFHATIPIWFFSLCSLNVISRNSHLPSLYYPKDRFNYLYVYEISASSYDKPSSYYSLSFDHEYIAGVSVVTKENRIISSPLLARHSELITAIVYCLGSNMHEGINRQGFITSKGRYVNRKEGLEIAKKHNGMIRKEVENNHKELFSETLF